MEAESNANEATGQCEYSHEAEYMQGVKLLWWELLLMTGKTYVLHVVSWLLWALSSVQKPPDETETPFV